METEDDFLKFWHRISVKLQGLYYLDIGISYIVHCIISILYYYIILYLILSYCTCSAIVIRHSSEGRKAEEGRRKAEASLHPQPQCTVQYSTVQTIQCRQCRQCSYTAGSTNSDKHFIRIMAKSHKDKVVHKAMKSIDKFYNEVPGKSTDI